MLNFHIIRRVHVNVDLITFCPSVTEKCFVHTSDQFSALWYVSQHFWIGKYQLQYDYKGYNNQFYLLNQCKIVYSIEFYAILPSLDSSNRSIIDLNMESAFRWEIKHLPLTF